MSDKTEPRGEHTPMAFEGYPELAKQIEKFANIPMNASIREWSVFIAALNNALEANQETIRELVEALEQEREYILNRFYLDNWEWTDEDPAEEADRKLQEQASKLPSVIRINAALSRAKESQS